MSLPEIITNLEKWAMEKKAGFEGLGSITAAKAERLSKEKAGWQDRTGNARQGLKGHSFWNSSTEMKVALSHRVDYGVYLELANDGKYAILEPTINSLRDEFYRNAKKIMDK